MGYTHYWQQKRDFTREEMLQIGDGVAKLIKAASGQKVAASCDPNHSLVICGGAGIGKPELTEEKIVFNGKDGLSHETFAFLAQRELPYEGASADRLGWAFCKTARRPYDIVVVATLAYLAHSWNFEVDSDGDAEDWEAGVELAQNVLAMPIPNPMIVEALVGGNA